MEEKVSTLSPLMLLAACFAGGIALGSFLEFGWQTGVIASLVIVAAAAMTAAKRTGILFLFVAFAAAGAASLQIEKNSVAGNRLRWLYDDGRLSSGEPLEIEGVVHGKPEPAFDGFVLDLRAEKIIVNGAELEVSGRVKMFAPANTAESKSEYAGMDLGHGSRVRIACNPEREERYLNPGVMRRKENLDRQGIDATATIKSPLLIEKLNDANAFAPLSFIYDLRASLIEQFRDKFSVSTAGVLIASLLGDKYFLDKQTADVFREGGTFHVLVISGLHITFIGGLTLLFVGFFTNRKVWQFTIAVLFLWAYTLAVGADVPVVRASVMFTVLLFSQVIYRKGTLLNALGFCSLLILAWRPSELFDPSFQLTFVSVAAIVGMAFPLIEKLREIGKWTPTADTPFPPTCPRWLRRTCETLYWRESVWSAELRRQVWSAALFKAPYLRCTKATSLQGVLVYLFEGIVVSLIVQIWLLPLLVFYFHRVSPASVLLNLWVGVIIALESFAAVAAILLSSIADSLAVPFIWITEILNWLLLSIPAFVVELDSAGFRVPVYSGTGKAIYVVYFLPVLMLAAAAYTWDPFRYGDMDKVARYRRQTTYLAPSTALLLIAAMIFHPFSSPLPDGKLQIDFLDVGQGDAALLTFPNGQTMLIDGGGRMNYGDETFVPDVLSVGEAVVSEFLWEKGYSKIDFIVATHADSDHMQGLTYVVRNFDVSKAYFGPTAVDDADFMELSEVLMRKAVTIDTIRQGNVLEIGGARIEVLYPGTDNALASTNNGSVVLRIVFGNHSFLFTGDIERDAEIDLLASRGELKAQIVKVPHHGSRTSSAEELLSAVKAETAIISVGRRSMYGHPHPEVVDRWEDSGAKVMTTGGKGTITVSSDGHALTIQSFLP